MQEFLVLLAVKLAFPQMSDLPPKFVSDNYTVYCLSIATKSNQKYPQTQSQTV